MRWAQQNGGVYHGRQNLREKHMNYPIYCTFNEDSAFAELQGNDGSMIAVNCSALEDELDLSRNQRTELN